MILDSFTALRVEEIAAEIERTASNNIDGMSVKNYYEAALWQCFYLSDTNIKVDDLRRKVRITIQQSPKEQAHTLATTVVTCNLPLDEILPCTAETLRETNDRSPLKKQKVTMQCDVGEMENKLNVPRRHKSANDPSSIEASSASSVRTNIQAVSRHAMIPQATETNSHENSSTVHEELRQKWLTDMESRLNKYDGKILRRHIEDLSIESLQQVINTCLLAFNAYREKAGDKQVSKMAMRRILTTTFAKLSPSVQEIHELQKTWEATTDRTKRKSKNSVRNLTAEWKRHA